MKKYNGLWVSLVAGFLITACSGDDKGKSNSPVSAAVVTKAASPTISYVSKYEVPSEQDGVTVSYKLCQVNQPGYDATLMFLYNRDKKQVEYDAQKEAEALEAGKPFKNTWSDVRSARLVETCPTGADGRCEVSNFITSYYIDSPKMLSHFKKNCALLSKNVWTDNP